MSVNHLPNGEQAITGNGVAKVGGSQARRDSTGSIESPPRSRQQYMYTVLLWS